jgi:hypothetical protein
MLGNSVVIPAGSPATAEITEVRRKGMWGKSGRIEARVLSVRVGDRLIRLTGTFDDKGVTGTAGVVAAIAFAPIAGVYMTGTSAQVPAGGGVQAFRDEDLAVAAPDAPAAGGQTAAPGPGCRRGGCGPGAGRADQPRGLAGVVGVCLTRLSLRPAQPGDGVGRPRRGCAARQPVAGVACGAIRRDS